MATQQEVMKDFMNSLDETEFSGRSALDEAVKKSSSFKSYQEVLDKFNDDWNATDNWHTFLVKYCGIILDNKDTGAISGSDAGGTTSKGAKDIIPCKGDASYPSGTSFTVDGLTIYGVPDKDDLTEDEQFVVQGLYSWWIRDALALIKESYGLSYSEENTTNSRMKLRLFEEDSGRLAYVEPDSKDLKIMESRTLGINMENFQDMSSDNRHGKTEDGFNMDRTLVHELTHGVMASNINYMPGLPLPIIEGATAELIHGADDNRRNDIIKYAKNEDSSFENLVKYLNPESAGVDMSLIPYAGGYIFMRYFLKQAADTNFDYDSYRENVSVDEENFATNYHDNVKMFGTSKADTITNSGEKVSINTKGGANTVKNYSDYVTLKAGSGNDSITNEGANIKVTLGAGDDAISNSGSQVTIKAGAGDDSILNTSSQVTIKADTGDDLIENYGASSFIYGGAKHDTISNFGTNIFVSGGAGKDVLSNKNSNVTLSGDGGNDSISNGLKTSSGLDTNTSVESNNSSIGANSTLYGGAGKDSITNYAYEIFLYGDAGNDLIENSGVSSFIYGGKGNDSITNSGASSALYGDGGNDLIENSSASSFIYGGAGKDSITNSGSNSTLYGDAGNDLIENSSASSFIYGGAGKDSITNTGSNSTLYGDTGNDSIKNSGDEVYLVCGAGNDSVYNSGSKISLDGGAGKDYFYSEGSVISISGGAGDDSIYNFGDRITISGDAGNDYISNDGGKHIVYQFGADFGNDTVVGFNADDTVKIMSGGYSTAESGDDVIISVENSSMLLKDAKGKEINFVDENDETFSEAANVPELWFVEEDNFLSADNLGVLVKDNSIAYDTIETTDFKNLAQDNLIAIACDTTVAGLA